MNVRRFLAPLIVTGLVLPVVVCLLMGLSQLLRAMGDAAGATAIAWLALGAGTLWVLDLVAMLFVVAIQQVAVQPPDREERHEDGEEP